MVRDQLVGDHEQRGRQCQPERLRGACVDRELDLRRSLDGQLGRLRALEDLADVIRGAATMGREIRAERDQRACLDEFLQRRKHYYAPSQRESSDFLRMCERHRIPAWDDGVVRLLDHRSIGAL
jgi:hypothetical protein